MTDEGFDKNSAEPPPDPALKKLLDNALLMLSLVKNDDKRLQAIATAGTALHRFGKTADAIEVRDLITESALNTYGLDANKIQSAWGKGAEHLLRTKQIDEPPDFTLPSRHLAELLEKYSIVLVGGSNARIITWKNRRLYSGDGGEHEVPCLLTVNSFHLYHQDKFISSKGEDGAYTRQQASKVFINKARRYDDLVFIPGAEREIGSQLNLWRGFGVVPKKGSWPLMRAHMREVMAGGNDEQDSYNFRWIAWTVQNPGQQAEVAIVFRGHKGSGKGTLGNALCRIFGRHGLQVSDKKHLTGTFNMHMSQCAFLFADEAYWPGDKDGEGALKRLITEPTLTIEPKGLDLFTVPNNLHVMIAGNEEWIIPASGDERRYAVNEVSNHRKGNTQYFTNLYAEMSNGGLAAMLYDLKAENLGRWHPRNDVPQTAGLHKQKALSRRGIDRLVEIIALDGVIPCRPDDFHRNIAVTTGEDDGRGFYVHARNLVLDLKHMSSITIATTLVDDWGCGRWKSGVQRGIRFPPLQELRDTFVKKHGAYAWPDNESWE
jgi:Family of unknown function (DUF5906)